MQSQPASLPVMRIALSTRLQDKLSEVIGLMCTNAGWPARPQSECIGPLSPLPNGGEGVIDTVGRVLITDMEARPYGEKH